MAIVKTNIAGYVIDTSNGLVINTNDKELQTYRAQVVQSQKISSLEEDINMLKAMLLEMRK